MFIEIIIVLVSLASFFYLVRSDQKNLNRIISVFIAVLLIEYFTQSLWVNAGLEPWAYLYLNVSWVLTLAWTTIIMWSYRIVGPADRIRTYLVSLGIASAFGLVMEFVLSAAGIRQYGSDVLSSISGVFIGSMPIEALYAVPVFIALSFSFAEYAYDTKLWRRSA